MAEVNEPGLTVADIETLQRSFGQASINGAPMELLGIEQSLERIETLLKKLLEKK